MPSGDKCLSQALEAGPVQLYNRQLGDQQLFPAGDKELLGHRGGDCVHSHSSLRLGPVMAQGGWPYLFAE